MQDKKQIIGLILSVVLSVGLVVIGVNAATTVGNAVVVGDALTVTATTTLNSSVALDNAADLTVGTGTSTFAGDVTLGDAAADNIRITGTIKSATTSLLSIGAGQVISKHISTSTAIDFGSVGAATCATASISISGVATGDLVSVTPPYAFAIEHEAISWSAYATTNVAVVKLCNPSAGATPNYAVGNFRVDIWQH